MAGTSSSDSGGTGSPPRVDAGQFAGLLGLAGRRFGRHDCAGWAAAAFLQLRHPGHRTDPRMAISARDAGRRHPAAPVARGVPASSSGRASARRTLRGEHDGILLDERARFRPHDALPRPPRSPGPRLAASADRAVVCFPPPPPRRTAAFAFCDAPSIVSRRR